MSFFRRLSGHFKTVCEHKARVFLNCCRSGIVWQGIVHDLSKFSPAEFIPGVKYYLGSRSPNARQREDVGYSLAWMHHKGRNKHHFEYWNDLNPVTKTPAPVKMPLKYLIEMFCDRKAACRTYQKDKYTDSSPLTYFKTKGRPGEMHPETAAFLEKLLTMLAERGEAETFRYIRSIRKKGDY